MITVSCQILFVNVEIMVTIQLPELTVYNIEMLIAEVCSHLVNVFLFLQKLYNMKEVWPPKFWQCNATTPWPVHAVVDTCNHLRHTEIVSSLIISNMSCLYILLASCLWCVPYSRRKFSTVPFTYHLESNKVSPGIQYQESSMFS